MPINQYFQNTLSGGTNENEFNVLQDLIIESIKQYGIAVKYIPRTLVKEDDLFSEDILSTFDNAADIEMYMKNVENFEGEGTFLSRFGLELRDNLTLTVARKRFNQFQDEGISTEVGYNLLTEDGDKMLIEDASGDNYALSLGRPFEGDLIYLPLNGKIYEIKFVEHEDVFYQLGKLYVYDLKCELFTYSSDRFDTGNTVIDSIETAFSSDTRFTEVILETGDNLLNETGGTFILESYRLEDFVPQANNEALDTEEKADNILNSSESTPFGSYKF